MARYASSALVRGVDRLVPSANRTVPSAGLSLASAVPATYHPAMYACLVSSVKPLSGGIVSSCNGTNPVRHASPTPPDWGLKPSTVMASCGGGRRA